MFKQHYTIQWVKRKLSSNKPMYQYMHTDNYMYKDTYNTLDILYANTSSLVFNGCIILTASPLLHNIHVLTNRQPQNVLWTGEGKSKFSGVMANFLFKREIKNNITLYVKFYHIKPRSKIQDGTKALMIYCKHKCLFSK